MLDLIRSLVAGGASDRLHVASVNEREPPAFIDAEGAHRFVLPISHHNGFPILDWDAANAWVDSLPTNEKRAAAWIKLERAWLVHMQASLGSSYNLQETEDAFLLSSLRPSIATATLSFVSRTLRRVVQILDGIADVPEFGKDILLVFDDSETYYRYAAHYYQADGEFSTSGGMFINAGCGHFATFNSDLQTLEPVIAHELTHSCVSHLPIPAWLNEGLAVNTEQRICPPGSPMYTPLQMHAKHLAFWGESEIQEFWIGKSFLRTDDGNMLSYDLARILISQMSEDWQGFRAFVLNADRVDAGASAAAEHLHLDLGIAVASILERESSEGYAPNPESWRGEPERGAF